MQKRKLSIDVSAETAPADTLPSHRDRSIESNQPGETQTHQLKNNFFFFFFWNKLQTQHVYTSYSAPSVSIRSTSI